jgi:gamma-glutamylcyclotransferase (GGCT)/AIG2-like uncharacterized protein YtfP
MKHYYFGYGMNTNKHGMANRCPDAVALGAAMLPDYDFRFAYHADVVQKPGAKTVGVLWELTDRCLTSLDRLEGYPIYYDRVIAPVIYRDKVYDSIVYVMTPGNQLAEPSPGYWDMLVEGYTEFDVSKRQLHRALAEAKDTKYNRHSTYDYVSPSYLN